MSSDLVSDIQKYLAQMQVNRLSNKAAVARRETKRLIKEGHLVQKPCAICGDENVHVHHYDYANPSDVEWLCARHHAQYHAAIRNDPTNAPRYEKVMRELCFKYKNKPLKPPVKSPSRRRRSRRNSSHYEGV